MDKESQIPSLHKILNIYLEILFHFEERIPLNIQNKGIIYSDKEGSVFIDSDGKIKWHNQVSYINQTAKMINIIFLT